MINEGRSFMSDANYRLRIGLQECIHDLHALGKPPSAKADLGGPHDEHERTVVFIKSHDMTSCVFRRARKDGAYRFQTLCNRGNLAISLLPTIKIGWVHTPSRKS